MRCLPSILSLFRNEFNKFNNRRARVLDDHDDIDITLKSHFCCKNDQIKWHYVHNVIIWASLRFPKICKPLVVYRFYCISSYEKCL